ncbi:asparagine synthase-related protein [Rhodococcoides corynebacterioides]|uniref:asparagine synthase (glutamine-hydrolyzing) n=2 Tax=Rhodococcoides corynebacterioides TaxID=53972 RepID=A0ABS7P0Z3_9NOCA|nr:asparagine synthase-related protein [Rhodococcus corynebacterioides]MBY6350625.1 hypothetical protein [Rhodococcus corynebacterioides]MBY6366079.1 hypothetical protein [Rhodococcus corynebacterioides]
MTAIYHTRLTDSREHLISSSARLLAGAVDAAPDAEALALQLLDFMPHPVNHTAMWSGVECVEPGNILTKGSRGNYSTRRWWHPPSPTRTLHDAREDVRRELIAAVELRTGMGPNFAADLSGGLDSTPICHLAGRSGRQFVARTVASRDAADQDMEWAAKAASSIPGLVHLKIPAENVPLYYSELDAPVAPTDEPATTLLEAGRQFVGLKEVSSNAETLLTGVGGDHLFTPPFALLRTALQTQPAPALKRIRQASLQNGWRLRDVLASARPIDYPTWIDRCKNTLDRRPSLGAHALDWDSPPHLPAWATSNARDAVISALEAASRHATPLSQDRGQHADQYMIHHGTRIARVLNEGAFFHHAIRFEHPYFDDRLIESCMQIRPLERSDPWNFKPVIKSAMQGIIHPAMQLRQDKGAGSVDKYAGLANNRQRISDQIENSLLAEMGLIDVSRLKSEIDGAPQIAVLTEQLDATLATEKWLRTAL